MLFLLEVFQIKKNRTIIIQIGKNCWDLETCRKSQKRKEVDKEPENLCLKSLPGLIFFYVTVTYFNGFLAMKIVSNQKKIKLHKRFCYFSFGGLVKKCVLNQHFIDVMTPFCSGKLVLMMKIVVGRLSHQCIAALQQFKVIERNQVASYT